MQLARRNFRPLVVISVIVAIPSIVIGMAARTAMPATPADPAAIARMASAALVILGLAAINMCVTSVGMGALVAAAAEAYEGGRALEPMTAIRRALRSAPAIVLGNLLAAAIVGLAVVALVTAGALLLGVLAAAVQLAGGGLGGVASQVVGVVSGVGVAVGSMGLALLIGVRYANITAAAVLEGLGPWRALRRSVELVRGRLWRTAGVVAIGVVLYLVAYLTALALAAVLLRDAELAGTASGAVVLLVYPFVGCLMTVLYYDLRIRREGYDVELMALALGGPDGDGGDGGTVDGAGALVGDWAPGATRQP